MLFSVLLGVLCPLTISSAVCQSINFFFVTDNSYSTSTLDSVIIASAKIAGSVVSVRQQCRRNCAQNPSCQAFDVILTQNTTYLGVFICNFFELNACNWESISLTSTSTTSFSQLWEKINLKNTAKPKACVQYCGVAYKGNCQACRGVAGLTGLDCDIAPRLCSDYQFSTWASTTIWPWGFYGHALKVSCFQQYTRILVNDGASGTHIVGTISRDGWILHTCSTAACLDATIAQIDWLTISYLVSISVYKEFFVYETFTTSASGKHFFGGLELSSTGELSLNSSQDSLPTGFPIPLHKAPFVYRSASSGCSAFWQFDSNVSVCSQRTHFLNYGSHKWNGFVGESGLSLFFA